MTVSSKVLVFDSDHGQRRRLKSIFDECSLIGLCAEEETSIQQVLRSNIDLGAVFIDDSIKPDTLRLIRETRTELPVFRRCRDETLESAEASGVTNYGSDDDRLRQEIESRIFTREYPLAITQTIASETRAALSGVFGGAEVETEPAYLIHDRLIFGELFSLIRLESDWCRGYMMLQTEEADLGNLLVEGIVPGMQVERSELNYRQVNSLLGELTNAIWGRLKSELLPGSSKRRQADFHAEIPSVVNHARRYVSFGSEEPKLCMKHLISRGPDLAPAAVFQKFAFHLKWEPEGMETVPEQIDEMVDSGGVVFL